MNKDMKFSGRCGHGEIPGGCRKCQAEGDARQARITMDAEETAKYKRQAMMGGSKLYQSRSRAVGNR